MATKKKSASAGKKQSGPDKGGRARTAGKKAKRVLADVLAGAAEGAVRGAAEAAMADTAKGKQPERNSKKSGK